MKGFGIKDVGDYWVTVDALIYDILDVKQEDFRLRSQTAAVIARKSSHALQYFNLFFFDAMGTYEGQTAKFLPLLKSKKK